jgi:signal recognition particle receptor subunit beta
MSQEINVEIMRGLGPEFAQHLNISNNNRIIFSGKFGKGKTTFIKYFFENQDDFFDEIKFLPIYIKPINYSISKNENILQYIKYDILIELIKKIEEPDFVKDGVAVAKVFPEYIENFQEELGKKILYFLPKIGKSLPVVGDILEAFFEDLNNFVTEKESANTNFVLGKFLKNVEESNFSIYENDIITKLIINIISELKLKTILIIDDLDRIDPDHIFRILNVFSVHFDENDNEIFINKFGLDKIMTVCDIKNLRHTFISKYGADVDFNGYIDKFYSKEVFHFQNHNQIKDFCIKHLSSQLVQTKNATNIIGQILNRNIGIDFFSMITILIEYNYISLRSILNYNFKNKLFEDFNADGPLLNFHNTTVHIEIKALSALCGGFESFVKIIKSLIIKKQLMYFLFLRFKITVKIYYT